MDTGKFFWGINQKALKETGKILKDPDNPQYVSKVYTILSRTDNVKEVFSIIKESDFMEKWPKIRQYWLKINQAEEFYTWWQNVFNNIAGKFQTGKIPVNELANIGKFIRETRINKEWTQSDLARRTGIGQALISRIEKGKNIELETLIKICKSLDLNYISF